jgi:hypothetical protein
MRPWTLVGEIEVSTARYAMPWPASWPSNQPLFSRADLPAQVAVARDLFAVPAREL